MQLSRTIRSKVMGATCALLIIAISASYVFADELSSSGFRFNDSGFTQLGGYSNATSFTSFGTLQPIANGESTSSSFSLAGGYLYPADSSPLRTQNWRWYDDAAQETPLIPYAAENTAPSAIPYNDPFKLRITVNDVDGNGVSNLKLRLQYSTSSDFSTGSEYVGEIGTCSTTTWCYVDGGGTNNAVILESTLSDAQFCSGGVGNGCGSYNESGTSASPFYHFPATRKEYDFAIKQTNAEQNTVYFFRLVDSVTSIPVPLNTGESYPSLMVSGGTLSFSIEGLSSGASTEGVVTDITTLPTAVPFGSLPIGTSRTAAHRLTVSTNATSGYKIYAYQRQGLLGPGAHEIPPVTATNDTPSGWSVSCAATSTGCYGYHAGKDVLEGGSTRFAADDTYAQFSTSPSEVAYSSGPATNESTDIVYKVEVRGSQEGGVYQSAIVYILTPVF